MFLGDELGLLKEEDGHIFVSYFSQEYAHLTCS